MRGDPPPITLYVPRGHIKGSYTFRALYHASLAPPEAKYEIPTPHHPTEHPALRDEAAARIPVSVDVAQYAVDYVYVYENVDIQLDAKCGRETIAVYGLGSIDRLGFYPDAGR